MHRSGQQKKADCHVCVLAYSTRTKTLSSPGSAVASYLLMIQREAPALLIIRMVLGDLWGDFLLSLHLCV